MSRNDPGAATGTGVYPIAPPCVCGCAAEFHAFGQRGGQQVRTHCDTGGCPCRLYVAVPVDRGQPDRCKVCGAALSAIEAARLRESS